MFVFSVLPSLLKDKYFDAAHLTAIRQNKTYLNHLLRT